MTETISAVIDEIRCTKQELKTVIEAVEVRLSLKVEEINREVYRLKKENRLLHETIEKLDRKSKENNIVIFGLKHPPQNISASFILTELKRLTDVDVNEIDLNNFYSLGKTDSCPIKVEFISFRKKIEIITQKS